MFSVSTYEVRYSSMYESLIDEHFGIPNADGNQNSTLITQSHIVSGTLKPELSGSRQVATVMWRRNDTRQPFFFVAIRGVDLSGRKGAVSNVVAVDFSYNTVQTNNLSTKSIIGIVIGFSLGILLLAALVYIVVRRRYLTYEEGNTEEKADKTTPWVFTPIQILWVQLLLFNSFFLLVEFSQMFLWPLFSCFTYQLVEF